MLERLILRIDGEFSFLEVLDVPLVSENRRAIAFRETGHDGTYHFTVMSYDLNAAKVIQWLDRAVTQLSVRNSNVTLPDESPEPTFKEE